jgi:hypothetical protein
MTAGIQEGPRIPSVRPAAGAPGGNRTPNLLVRSQTLYPLSYGRSDTAYPGRSAGPKPDCPVDVLSAVVFER